MSTISQDKQERKDSPLARGLLDYFPAALMEVAALSRVANEQHNPGEEMHWARDKSSDHADCILRHLIERGTVDSDGMRHSAKVAWRALALLQEELEAAGATPGRASKWQAEEATQEFTDGWHPWDVDNDSAPPRGMVEVRFRDPDFEPKTGTGWCWSAIPFARGCEIVAYRAVDG